MFFFTNMFFLRFFRKKCLTSNRSENVTIGKSKKNGSFFKKNSPQNLDPEPTYGQFKCSRKHVLKHVSEHVFGGF